MATAASSTAPPPGPAAAPARASAETRGLWLGLLGVAIFALTLPMTRLAVGSPEAPHMSAVFIAMGRAAVAGLLSAALLLARRAPLPQRADWLPRCPRPTGCCSPSAMRWCAICTSVKPGARPRPNSA